jgi:hypothetical protein
MNTLRLTDYTFARKNNNGSVSVITDTWQMIVDAQIKNISVTDVNAKDERLRDEFQTLHMLYNFPFDVLKRWMINTKSDALASLRDMNAYYVDGFEEDSETIFINDDNGKMWGFRVL